MLPYLLLEDVNYSIRKPAKVSGVPLPPQYDLLRLLQDVENLHPSWNSITPACEWEQVFCTPPDEIEDIADLICPKPSSKRSGEISRFYWCNRGLRGTLNWNYLPAKLKRLNVDKNQLTGDVPFDVLPATLKVIHLSNNRFSGTPSFRHLPALEEVYLNENNFVGWVKFEFLALSVRNLFVGNNPLLQGSLDVAERADMCYSVINTKISPSNGQLSAFPNFQVD